MIRKAVVLLSGGLDSTTCLAIAKDEGYQPYALTINYGQHHNFELKAAQKVVQFFHIKNHSNIVQRERSKSVIYITILYFCNTNTFFCPSIIFYSFKYSVIVKFKNMRKYVIKQKRKKYTY